MRDVRIYKGPPTPHALLTIYRVPLKGLATVLMTVHTILLAVLGGIFVSHLRHAKKPRVLLVAELDRSQVRRDELHGHYLFVHRGNSSPSSVRSHLCRKETHAAGAIY